LPFEYAKVEAIRLVDRQGTRKVDGSWDQGFQRCRKLMTTWKRKS